MMHRGNSYTIERLRVKNWMLINIGYQACIESEPVPITYGQAVHLFETKTRTEFDRLADRYFFSGSLEYPDNYKIGPPAFIRGQGWDEPFGRELQNEVDEIQLAIRDEFRGLAA